MSADALETEGIPPVCDELQCRRISFCTTCMGRLHHLRQTLPENIRANKHHFPEIEFILLDYNSRDGLREWIETTLWEHVEAGRLAVYCTTEPKLYHSAHAKNVAHRLSTGRIVCNLDADNFLMPGYVEFVWRQFEKEPSVILFGKGRDATGRVTLLRNHFFTMGGYNEQLRGYGYDDVDLIHRAARHLSLRRYQVHEFNRYITHSHEERARNSEFSSIAASNARNRRIMDESLSTSRLIANAGVNWGRATVRRNYRSEFLEVR